MPAPEPFDVRPVATTLAILPEWTDANGHLNVAYYVLAFDRATDALFDRLGVGWDYLARDGHSMFTLAMNVDYVRELRAGRQVRIVSRVVAGDAKRLHYFHEMFDAAEGFLAATNEIVSLHVDMATRRGAPFPRDALARIAALGEAHAGLPWPPQRGRTLGLRRPG